MSELNDSFVAPYSTHRLRSDIDQRVLRHGEAFVNSLSTCIKSKIPVATMDINPVTSPQLENIKEGTSLISRDTFNVMNNLFQLGASFHSHTQGLLSQAQNNQPVNFSTFCKEAESLRKGGRTILDDHHAVIYQLGHFVERSWDGFDSRIREVFDQTESAEHWKGRVDVIKDHVVPQLSTVNPLLAPVEGAANVTVHLAAYEVLLNLDNKLKKLGISNQALQRDLVVAVKTKSALDEFLRHIEVARGKWKNTCEAIYLPEEPEVPLTLQVVKSANDKVFLFISLIKPCLVQNHDAYGNGISVMRNVESFCEVVPRIFGDIRMIYSAKDIIKSSHQAKFKEAVLGLGSFIFLFLQSMRRIFDQYRISPRKLADFLEEETYNLPKNMETLSRDIREILEDHISRRRRSKAEKERMAGDRCSSSGADRRGRPLVSLDEVIPVLARVERSVRSIYRLAISSGTGKIMQPVGGDQDEIETARIKFDASNDSITRLCQVLREDVDAGWKDLENLAKKEEPKSTIRRIRDALRFHHRK